MKRYAIKKKGVNLYAGKTYTYLGVYNDNHIKSRLNDKTRYGAASVDEVLKNKFFKTRQFAKEWLDPIVLAKYIEKLRGGNGSTFSYFEVEVDDNGVISCIDFDVFSEQYYTPKANKNTVKTRKVKVTEVPMVIPDMSVKAEDMFDKICSRIDEGDEEFAKAFNGGEPDMAKLQKINDDGIKAMGEFLAEMGWDK